MKSNAMLFGRSPPTFPPAYCQASSFAYSWTLKIEASFSSETSVGFYQTTRRYNPEDRTLHNHCSENLKSNYKIGKQNNFTCDFNKS
jgi:hypothetical protein